MKISTFVVVEVEWTLKSTVQALHSFLMRVIQPKLNLCSFYKLSVNDVQLMSILHITLYDGTCPSTRVKCITKEFHEITAILIQNNRYSLCTFFFKTRLAFKVWAGEFVLLLPSTCPKTHPFYSACSELVLED